MATMAPTNAGCPDRYAQSIVTTTSEQEAGSWLELAQDTLHVGESLKLFCQTSQLGGNSIVLPTESVWNMFRAIPNHSKFLSKAKIPTLFEGLNLQFGEAFFFADRSSLLCFHPNSLFSLDGSIRRNLVLHWHFCVSPLKIDG